MAGGALVDMPDLGQVLANVHDAEIEISEGREPAPCSAIAVTGRNQACRREPASTYPQILRRFLTLVRDDIEGHLGALS